MNIKPFEARKLQDSQFQELYDLECSVHEEIFPNDQPITFKLWKDLLLHQNPLYTVHRWLAVSDRKERIL
ncbi:unnamed protein product, partial [marine sediment metagenome]